MTKHAGGASTVDDCHAIKSTGEFRHFRVVHIRTQLGQVGTLERPGVDIHQHVAMTDHVLEQRVGNPVRQAAIGAPGKVAIEVTTVRQVAAALLETRQVDDGDADYPAGELVWFQVVHGAADDLNTVEFITVNGPGQAQVRAGFGTIDHQNRRWL